MNALKTLAAAVVALSVPMFADRADAATMIDVKDGATTLGTLTCPLGCLGFTAIGVLSATEALIFDASPPTIANEVAKLNELAGTSFTAADASKEDNGVIPFTISTEYFVLKFGGGPGTQAFFKNLFGPQEMTYAAVPGVGGGLSHKTSVGGPAAPIPLPAAGWMLLAGAGALVAAGRRRKA